MDIKKFTKKDEEYFTRVDGKTIAVENVLMGDDEDVIDKKKYRYDLSVYDGPLDLLLYLVRRNKIEIEDIFVSDITQQYLDIIGPIEDWTDEEIEYAGEFITLAAELIEIKSRLLIPAENVSDTPDDLPERDLYRRLEELKMFKMQAEKLKEAETINRFYREPVFSDDDYRIAIKGFDLDKLIDAYAEMIHRVAREELRQEPKKIEKERFSVSDRMNYISHVLIEEKHTSYFKLLKNDFNKLEAINTFLAPLELMKRQQITANQPEKFKDIEINLREGVETPITVTEDEIDGQFKRNG